VEVPVISPDQVDRLQDQHDKFAAATVVGCLFFIVGGTLGIFASQEFATGTDFMQRLAAAEQAFGLLLIVVGWIKLRSINAELKLNTPAQFGERSISAGAGH
jgi:hypothetical protein